MTFGSSKAALGTAVGNQFVVATEIYYERGEGEEGGGRGERGVKKKKRKKETFHLLRILRSLITSV